MKEDNFKIKEFINEDTLKIEEFINFETRTMLATTATSCISKQLNMIVNVTNKTINFIVYRSNQKWGRYTTIEKAVKAYNALHK